MDKSTTNYCVSCCNKRISTPTRCLPSPRLLLLLIIILATNFSVIDAGSLPPKLDHRVSSSALSFYDTAVRTSSILPRGNDLGRSAKKHFNGPLRRKSRCGQCSFIPPLVSKPFPTSSSSQDKFTVIAITTRCEQHLASLQNRKMSSHDFLLAMAKKSPEYASDNGEENNDVSRILKFTFMYVTIPFLPAIILHWGNDNFQFLKQQFALAASSSATAASNAAAAATSIANSADYSSISTMYNDALNALFVLLVSKRLALYFMATMATLYAGWRASRVMIANGIGGDDGFTSRVDGPGKALDRLNAEILRGQVLFDDDDDENENDNDETVNQNNLFASFIDENDKNDDGSKSTTTKAGNALALLLPVGLATSLGVSYMFLSMFNGKNAMEFHDDGDPGWNAVIQPFLVAILPSVASLPSLALCLLFTATEFRWGAPGMRWGMKAVDNSDGPDDNSFQSTHQLETTNGNATFKDEKYSPLLSMGNILALMYVAGAYFAKDHPTIPLLIPGSGVENSSYALQSSLDIWPLQNGVNIALATTVTRALAPFLVGFPFSSYPSATTSGSKTMDSKGKTQKKLHLSIQTIALASLGVTLFDAISVFGTVVNAASIDDMIGSSSNLIAADTASSSSISVMEAVARSKLSSSSVSSSSSGISPWQPGLLEIILGGRVTDALGLGDVVFPACLVAWAFVADAVAVRNRLVEEFENNGEGNGDYSNNGAVFSVNGVSNKGSYLYSYTTAAIMGYILGSFLTEIAGSFSLLGPGSSGLPALVFLIPCMLIAVVLLAAVRGEIEYVLLGGGE